MGVRLRTLAPNIVADARTNGAGSIFRIYRDIRFSKDKSPYKTYMGIFFWEGPRRKMENPGFYLHLAPPRLMLGAGIHMFPRPLLEAYRGSVVDPDLGPALVQAVEQVTSQGPYRIGGQHYKRIPRGYDPAHENASFLLYNGLSASSEGPIPPELHSAEFLDYCFERFEDMFPIHRWLVAMMEGMSEVS
jgi:uncharacterized protein (TIGR02453 family)